MAAMVQFDSVDSMVGVIEETLTGLLATFTNYRASFETQRKLEYLAEISTMRELCVTEEDKRNVGLAYANVLNIFSQLCDMINSYYSGCDGDSDRLVSALTFQSIVVTILANLSDYCAYVCEKLCECSHLERVLTQLNLADNVIRLRLRRHMNVDIYHGLLIVLYNVCRNFPEVVQQVLQFGGISIVKRYVEVDHELIKMQALFVLSFIVVTSRNEEVDANMVVTKENIDHILKVVFTCVSETDHCSKVYGFQLFEVLQSVSDIAHCSQRGVRYLLEGYRHMSILALLCNILTVPVAESSLNEEIYGQRVSLGGFEQLRIASKAEKRAAAHCCWALSYDQAGRQALLAQPALVAALRSTLCSADEPELQRIAYGALWNCGFRDIADSMMEMEMESNSNSRPEGRPSSPASACTEASCSLPAGEAEAAEEQRPKRRYVMISYQHQNSSTVYRIREALKLAGVDAWIDVENMSGNILNKIMKAVQQSTVVLLCISTSYKRSAYCRSEAENAFIMKKTLIPVRLDSYQPSGWLQAIVGAKYIHDLSQSDGERFESSLAGLVSSVRSKMLKEENRQAQAVERPLDLAVSEAPITISHDSHATLQSSPIESADSARLSDVSIQRVDTDRWSEEDVQVWLTEAGLGSIANRFANINGSLLSEMRHMERVAPQFFYTKLESEFHFSFVELLSFVRSLRRLTMFQ